MLRSKTILILAIILLSFPSFLSISAEGTPTFYPVSVQIWDINNQSVCDEKVMIREHRENASPIICEDYTNCGGLAYFFLEKGSYWVDVRNIWVPLTVENDTAFEFPYRIISTTNPDGDKNSIQGAEPYIVIAVALIIVAFIICYIVSKRKSKS